MFQSALHRRLAAHHRSHPGETLDHPHMQATAVAGSALQDEPHAPHLSRHRELEVCAGLALRLAVALLERDHERAGALRSELQYQTCDPLWLETVAEYELSLATHERPFYVRHSARGDFVMEILPEQCTVALVADWGTGTSEARALLEQIRGFGPDFLLHLGDIYYSGTQHEVRAHFLDPIAEVFGSSLPGVYALSGNHDRYSGGHGYRFLLESLKQPASYFCLRNQHWQLLAMDTGLHDTNPRGMGRGATWLEASEVEWLREKITGFDGGTVLLSHHPLISIAGAGHDPEGHPVAVNPHLATAFEGLLDRVALWLWGHEHSLLAFSPYAGLQRGRCIGAAAIPLLVGQQRYVPPADLKVPQTEEAPPRLLPGTRLGTDGRFEHHAFAILRLDGPNARVDYHQTPAAALIPGHVPRASEPFFSELLSPSA